MDGRSRAIPAEQATEHRQDRRSKGTLTNGAIGPELARSIRSEFDIGHKTLADLSTGPAPDPLIGDFLTQDEPTILYGPGGIGKGMLSVYFAHRLVQSGRTVMVIDFEGHEGEWGRRARDMGFTDDQLKRVHYREPYGKSWKAPATGPLTDIADLIKRDCDDLNVSVIIIDSYTAATSNADQMGGQAAASEYFTALAKIGRTSLTIAHVAGNADKFPAKPFGSVFVHNFARETWAINAAENPAEITYEADTAHLQPTVMTVELRNMKMSQRKKVLDPKFIAFSFYPQGTIEVNEVSSPDPTMAEMAAAVMGRAGKSLAVKEIANLIQSDYGEKVNIESLRNCLKRRHKGITFIEEQSAPLKYALSTGGGS